MTKWKMATMIWLWHRFLLKSISLQCKTVYGYIKLSIELSCYTKVLGRPFLLGKIPNLFHYIEFALVYLLHTTSPYSKTGLMKPTYIFISVPLSGVSFSNLHMFNLLHCFFINTRNMLGPRTIRLEM